MKFWRRFKYYLIGFGLGLLLVYGIFGGRDLTTWTPEGRVLQAIDSSQVSISERALCQLECNSLSFADIQWIMEDADVDFSESSTRKKPCPLYHITAVDEKYFMIWEVCEKEEKVILHAFVSGNDCSC